MKKRTAFITGRTDGNKDFIGGQRHDWCKGRLGVGKREPPHFSGRFYAMGILRREKNVIEERELWTR